MFVNDETEAYHLYEIEDGNEVFDRDHEHFHETVKRGVEQDENNYLANRKAKVGSKLTCAGPLCSRKFVKKSYQHCFCCTKCKDQFWNRRQSHYGVKVPIVL